VENKKIIFIHLLNDFSGSPLILSQVIKICNETGYGTEIYSGKGTRGFLTDITTKHSTYFYKRFENRYMTLVTYLFSQMLLFLKLLKYKNENVVFYINTLLPFGAGLAGILLRKKTVYHIHETSITPSILKKMLRKLSEISYTANIYVSNYLLKHDEIPGVKSFCVYNAAGNEIFSEALQFEYSHNGSEIFTILMISSLKDYKGIPEFLKLAHLFVQNNHFKFELVLNAKKTRIDKYFSDVVIPGNITLHPESDNIIEFYKHADLVLNLSRTDQWIETFGLTILEAMSFGIPVIAPPVGGPTELVDDGVTGYLIDSYDIDKLAAKVNELASNPSLCHKISEAAKAKARKFTIDKFEKKIIEVLDFVNDYRN